MYMCDIGCDDNIFSTCMVQHDMPWGLSNVRWYGVTCNMLTWFLFVDGEM
jgi:hypothetical protein